MIKKHVHQFDDIIYRTKSRFLSEKNTETFVEPTFEEGYYDRREICGELFSYPTLLHIKVGQKILYSKQDRPDKVWKADGYKLSKI